jgi:hypothetical protein
VAVNDKVLTGEDRRRAPAAKETAGVLINGTYLLGDFMCIQFIHSNKEFSSSLFSIALLLASFTYWPGKVLVLADTLSRCLEGQEYMSSAEISRQAAELIPPVEAQPGDRMGHHNFIKLLMEPAREEPMVDLWSRMRKVPQPKETLTEILDRIKKRPAE